MAGQKRKVSLLLLSTWGLFFVILFGRIIEWRSDGIYVGHENVWSDWALHISLATIFAEKSPAHWFAYHPVYADGKLTYAFLANFFPGMLMRAGLPLASSFIFTSIVTALLLLEGMLRLIHLLTGSYRKALAAITLFFLSSGFGFLQYLADVWARPGLSTIFGFTRQYSRMEQNGWLSGNVIVGLLLPQRAFLLGMTLAVWGLYGLFHALAHGEGTLPKVERRKLVLAGLAVGLLPIAHMHTFIVLVILLVPVFLVGVLRPGRLGVWLRFGIPAGMLSSILFFTFVAGGIQKSGFIHWEPGYNARSFVNWLIFWWKAWGFLIPLSFFGGYLLWKRKKDVELSVFFAGLLVVFALANLILFQPISWDNSKLLYWVYFGLCILTAEALGWIRARKFGRAMVGVLIVGMTFTGVLEVWLMQNMQLHTHQLLGAEELKLADFVRANTGPLDRFLTSKSHNHFVCVRGVRPVLLGYTGWVWNYGFDYAETERDVDAMFRGGEAALPLLKKHRVSYVVIGPSELHELHANLPFFQQRFPLLVSSPRYQIFDVRFQ